MLYNLQTDRVTIGLKRWLRDREFWVPDLAVPFASRVTLDKVLTISETIQVKYLA